MDPGLEGFNLPGQGLFGVGAVISDLDLPAFVLQVVLEPGRVLQQFLYRHERTLLVSAFGRAVHDSPQLWHT
jgi:hypothetical protein